MTLLRFLTFTLLITSCAGFNGGQDLLPLSSVDKDMLLNETEEAEYRHLADLYGLSEERLNIKGNNDRELKKTEADWDIEQISLNEIENSSFVVDDYEVTFVDDKFKHEEQLVAEAKAYEAQKKKSRGIASVQPVSEVHKKRRPTTIFALAKKSTPESIRYFYKKKEIDLNEKNGQGDTPLHIAIKNKRYDNVRALLGLKANPNIPDASGKTVAQYADDLGLKSIQKLIKKK